MGFAMVFFYGGVGSKSEFFMDSKLKGFYLFAYDLSRPTMEEFRG